MAVMAHSAMTIAKTIARITIVTGRVVRDATTSTAFVNLAVNLAMMSLESLLVVLVALADLLGLGLTATSLNSAPLLDTYRIDQPALGGSGF